MLNFLPQKNKNEIVEEYLLRVIFFVLLFLFIASLVLGSLLMPSYFYVKYKNDNIKNQLIATKQENTSKDIDPILFIKNVNRLSSALSNTNSNGMDYSDIIDKVVSLKNKNIKILSINIVNDNSTNVKRITISGFSNQRDDLTSFEKDIKTDGFFDSVNFPVSDFIKDSNSDFSAALVYKNK